MHLSKYLLLVILPFFLIFSQQTQATYKEYKRPDAIISVTQLNALIQAKPSNVIVLAVTKPHQFYFGHIPGAYQVWRSDYSTSKDKHSPIEGLISNMADFQNFARSLAINEATTIVVYDHKYDATRLWWSFFYYGKTDVKVLDGGYQAWRKAGLDIQYGPQAMPSTSSQWRAKVNKQTMLASMQDVQAAKTNSTYQLWDTRSSREWDGSKLVAGAFRKGRIAWAKHLKWQLFRNPNTHEFLPADEINKILAEYNIDTTKKQVFYCQSGVRTTQAIFSMYLVGWPVERLLNYDGSWIEWSHHGEDVGLSNEK